MKIRGQQFLLRLQELRAAVDQFLFQRTAELHLLDTLALKVLRGFYSRLSGATMRLSNQYLVIDLMDRKRYVVSGKLCLRARGSYLGLGHIIRLLNFQQRGQGLGDLCSASSQAPPSLVENSVHRRNRCSIRKAQAASVDLDQLRIRHMHEAAVIPYRWKI